VSAGDAPLPARSTYWRCLLRAAPLILVLSVLSFFMERLGWFDHFETAWLDSFLILQSSPPPQDVVVVYITDNDYYRLFGGESPIDAAVLSKVIGAASRGGAAVIGVDIDTSNRSFQHLRIDPTWPTVVWGEDGIPNEDGTLKAVRARGGRAVKSVGLTDFPVDGDGVVRRYQRVLNSNGSTVPSLPWAIVQAFCSKFGRSCKHIDLSDGSTERLLLHFTPEPSSGHRLSASDVLEASTSPRWLSSRPFRDRIVLIGGSYRAGRDVIISPMGAKPGVSLIADAVRTELGQGPIEPLRDGLAFIVDLLIGALVVYISFRLPSAKAVALILLALPVIVGIGSFIAFATLAKWVNFIPVVLGMLIHQLYDYGAEYRRLVRSTHHLV
jgi:CHASE2 domain-containing sensor protein